MTERHFSLADLFELVADTVPERLALVAGTERRTYAELDERSTRLANHLMENGVGPGDKVAVYSWNRAEWIEAMFAAWKARAVPINVNYRYVAEELRYLFDNADVRAVIFERSFAPLVEEVAPDLPLLSQRIVLEDGSPSDGPGTDVGDAVRYEEALASASPERAGIERSSDDLYMLYTGGTTGMPKGVMWRHEDIFFAAMGGGGFGEPPIETPEEIVGRVKPEDQRMISMALAPVMHGAAQWGLCITLFGGGTTVLYTGRHFDPHEVWTIVEAERANSVMVVGDAMARPLAEALTEPGARYDTSSVFTVGSGGAIFSKVVQDQLRAQLGEVLIVDTFGASELGAGGSSLGAEEGMRFAANPSMTVLGEDLRPVAAGSGERGLLARRGHIPLGYYKDEAKTAATYVTDPDGVRWALPGDFALLEEDGSITLLGRGSGCINTGGEKVYPEEVEAALKSHPDVFDALVVGLPDDRFGERVAAVVAAREGTAPSPDDIAAHCRTKVAGYKVPRDVRFTETIGRTPAGKPDYRWAKALFA